LFPPPFKIKKAVELIPRPLNKKAVGRPSVCPRLTSSLRAQKADLPKKSKKVKKSA